MGQPEPRGPEKGHQTGSDKPGARHGDRQPCGRARHHQRHLCGQPAPEPPVWVEPGLVTIDVGARDHLEASKQLAVAKGQLKTANITLVPTPAPAAQQVATASTPGSGLSNLSVGNGTKDQADGKGGSGWLWTGVGAAVIGGVVAAYFLTQSDESTPPQTNSTAIVFE